MGKAAPRARGRGRALLRPHARRLQEDRPARLLALLRQLRHATCPGLLRRLHGGTQHVGKVYLPPDPTRRSSRSGWPGLRRKLDRAVQSEDFERAAQIRDLIRTLEGAL
jgi:hypothetical protein